MKSVVEGGRAALETRMQRQQLEFFLAAEPAMISIKRATLMKTAAGGYVKSNPQNLEPQRFRMIPFKRRLTVMTRDTPDGVIFRIDYVLVGKYDADVRVEDEFEFGGGYYRVLSIEPNRLYRTAAHVVGQGATHGDSPQ